VRHCALLRYADRDAIPQTRPRDIVIVLQTPPPRGFFSDQAYVVEPEIEPRRAIADVAANSRSDSQFPRKFSLATVSRLSIPAGLVMGAGSERTPTLPVGRPRGPIRDSSGRFSVKASKGSTVSAKWSCWYVSQLRLDSRQPSRSEVSTGSEPTPGS